MLSSIDDDRLRRYIELEVLKMVALETQDTKVLRNLNRIRIKNPLGEKYLKYCEAYNAFQTGKTAEKAGVVNSLGKELVDAAETLTDIIRDVSIKEEDFLEQAPKAASPEAMKLNLEFRFLKHVLNNLFKFTASEGTIQ